ncbi:hypothetical protein MalM25_33520 [Planctomycetes bacterium MalM25]|nr:hypothetical protein MalM25_33520 [Planctomycetes bacterium MalM25]
MSLWEGLLLAAAVLVAVRSLVGMMRHRAERLVGEVQKQVDQHREREQAQNMRERRKQMQDAA